MLAVSIHQIAVQLFELGISGHKDDGVTEWSPPKSDEIYWESTPEGPPPTMFTHSWYTDHQDYPSKVADMVGYWAENRIFGGVVLFKHNTDHSDAVYLHPDREFT